MKQLPEAPLQMDRFTRNARLYEHLLGMGLCVDPVCIDGDLDKIDQLIVYTAPPKINLTRYVDPPVEGSEIADGVTSPGGHRNNVVDFPSELGSPVSVHRE